MQLIDLGNTVVDEALFTEFLDQICNRLEVDNAAYAGKNPVTGEIHGFVNYCSGWKEHYAQHDFARFDPTLSNASRSIAPVDWGRLPRNDGFHKIFRDAHDFGISSTGLTIPVRGPFGDIGMLSVTRDSKPAAWRKHTRQIVGDLQSFAVHLHDTVMRSGEMSRILHRPALSSREKEVLQWIAAGKTYLDVGEILSISDRTVEVHMRSAREKLGSLTTTQAVARAIGIGLIYPL